MAQLKNYLQTTDFDTIAEEAMKAYKSANSDVSEERKELNKSKEQLNNATKAILNGLDYPELQDEIKTIRLRISALEQKIAAASAQNMQITKEDIVAKLKKDVEHITPDDMPRLVKTYVTKIYAHNNEIIITGGVNLPGCGGRI